MPTLFRAVFNMAMYQRTSSFVKSIDSLLMCHYLQNKNHLFEFSLNVFTKFSDQNELIDDCV